MAPVRPSARRLPFTTNLIPSRTPPSPLPTPAPACPAAPNASRRLPWLPARYRRRTASAPPTGTRSAITTTCTFDTSAICPCRPATVRTSSAALAIPRSLRPNATGGCGTDTGDQRLALSPSARQPAAAVTMVPDKHKITRLAPRRRIVLPFGTIRTPSPTHSRPRGRGNIAPSSYIIAKSDPPPAPREHPQPVLVIAFGSETSADSQTAPPLCREIGQIHPQCSPPCPLDRS